MTVYCLNQADLHLQMVNLCDYGPLPALDHSTYTQCRQQVVTSFN